MLVMNMLKTALPTKAVLKNAEVRDRAGLQYRRLEPLSSPKSLTPEEADRLQKYDGQMWLEKAPRWDGNDFPFAPNGEQGSVYNLPAEVAGFLCEKYNKGAALVCEMETDVILKVIEPKEIPEGVTPLQPDLNDPLRFSSESFRAYAKDGTLVYATAGYAQPPEKRAPQDLVVAPTAAQVSAPSAAGVRGAAAASGEPVLKK